MLNELEVTVEGEDIGGKEEEEEEDGGLALGFPAKALEKGAWGHDLPAAVVLSGVEEEEHSEVETAEDGMAADVVGGGGGLLMG